MTTIINLRTAVYRYFNASGELIYIGVAADPDGRARQHEMYSTWWPEVDPSRTTVRWHDTREAALDEEAEVIRDCRPRHNTVVPRRRPERSGVVLDSLPAMSLAVFRNKLAERIDLAHFRQVPTVVAKAGKPRALLIPHEWKDILLEALAARGIVPATQQAAVKDE